MGVLDELNQDCWPPRSDKPAWRARRHKLPQGQCPYCDAERAIERDFHPPHDASPRCESGRHNHCSCDICF